MPFEITIRLMVMKKIFMMRVKKKNNFDLHELLDLTAYPPPRNNADDYGNYDRTITQQQQLFLIVVHLHKYTCGKDKPLVGRPSNFCGLCFLFFVFLFCCYLFVVASLCDTASESKVSDGSYKVGK